ncbi:MAG: hypothetical protein H8D56_03210 [Planctomycetes bacterium]|nr:hypothetical protein [Planctomycetota bacterium]MBL7143691.1 hypothetical protein [Phycisphaerae bacterium]
MLRRTETTIRTIVCAVMIVLLTCCGVLMGSIQAWHRMGLCFFLAVYSAECCVCVLLNHKIESHFIQLEAQFTGKSPSDRLGGKFVPNSLIISMIIFILIFFALVFLAGNCGYWLILSIPIVVFLIANFVLTAIIVWLKIKYCTKWLEELVSSGREGEKHT